MVTVRATRPCLIMINGRTAPISKGTVLEVDEETAKHYPLLEVIPVPTVPTPVEPTKEVVQEAPKKPRRKSGRSEAPVSDQEPNPGTTIIP